VAAAMPSVKFWSRSLSRVEIDQRSREALLQLDRMERLLIWRAAVRQSRLRRVSIHRGAPEERWARGPLSDRLSLCCSTFIAPIVSGV
jgi:hypothetical protein